MCIDRSNGLKNLASGDNIFSALSDKVFWGKVVSIFVDNVVWIFTNNFVSTLSDNVVSILPLFGLSAFGVVGPLARRLKVFGDGGGDSSA